MNIRQLRELALQITQDLQSDGFFAPANSSYVTDRIFQRLEAALATEARLFQLGKLSKALEFAEGAIEDAITLEDGLDGKDGQAVLKMIRNALGSRQ